MTKRYGNFEEVKNKKQKLEDNLDDLWGDELDDDAFDDCIRIATQVEENIVSAQDHNKSVLPNYNIFKEPNNLFCSTQINNSIQVPTTSKNGTVYQPEIKKLQIQYDEKVGEISILRNQLQETKNKLQLDQQKKEEQWIEKFQISQKEIKSLQSELQFKNLEIANLKQKILDVSKYNYEASFSQNVSKTALERKQISYFESATIICKKEAIFNPIYPLKNLATSSLFNTLLQEDYFVRAKSNKQCRNTIPYLQNQVFHDDYSSPMKSKPEPLIMNEKEVSLDYIYPEISYLIQCTTEDINLEENYSKINKILCVSIQFLLELKNYLIYVRENTKIEDIQQSDYHYLEDKSVDSTKYNSERVFERDKIGIKAGRTILFVSQLLPHSFYLSSYLIHGKKLKFTETDDYKMNFPFFKRNKFEEQFYYLNLILSIIEILGKIRKACDMSGFLYTVVDLLINVCKSNNYDCVRYTVCKMTKEILFSRPSSVVVYKLSYFFKHASLHSNFVEFLFKKSNNSLKITSKKGILYYNQDSCCFYVFAVLFVNTIFKRSHQEFPIKVCVNLLSFIYNTFKCSIWLHHKNTKQCECLAQLYKLEIDIVFKALNRYNSDLKNKKLIAEEWNHFFQHEITMKVLNLMTFNSYELTEKYVSVYSQYKEIQRHMVNNNVDEFEKLAVSEDIPEIPSTHNAFGHL